MIRRIRGRVPFLLLLYVSCGVAVFGKQVLYKIRKISIAPGFVITAAALFLLLCVVIMGVCYHVSHREKTEDFMEQCLRSFVAVIPAVLFGMAYCRKYDTTMKRFFLTGAVLFTIAFIACVWFLSVSRQEKEALAEKV